jgi:HD-GYP domain-containing protein (c-di-GMP phosphodiesterase class II)
LATVETPAAPLVHADEVGTELVARARAHRRLVGRDEAVALTLGVAFLAAATSAALLLPSLRPFSYVIAVISVLAYAVVSRVAFEVGNGFVYPAQLVLVPMLFTLPPGSVPLLVAAGFLLGQLPNFARGRMPLSHVPIVLANASHSLGPALVLSLGGASSPSWHDLPLYAGALAAQFAADFLPSSVWSRIAWRVPLAEHASAMRMPVLVDAALAPIGLVVAMATGRSPFGLLVVVPLVALLQVFARERQVRIDHALQLSTAYRGTAILLGDVIEADDEYTGAHSRDVVELVLEVADKLGLDPVERQRTEFAALLHDVGKVKIPSELINKPGPLEPAERALMNTHTIIGQNMLDQVGGMLGEVGHIVRSCHERWDGAGYPDGLAGENIPLAARIVCACDAWSAMTSDRSYRKALPRELAAAELCACAGTQFDPRVVAALVSVLGL